MELVCYACNSLPIAWNEMTRPNGEFGKAIEEIVEDTEGIVRIIFQAKTPKNLSKNS